MQLRLKSRRFAAALCVLALCAVHVFGSDVAYYCLCGGKPVPSQTSHCHGPHGERCHDGDARAGDPHSEENSGDRENHQAVDQDLPLRPVEAAAQVVAPQVACAISPLIEKLLAGWKTGVASSNPADFPGSPPSGLTVARTVILRI